jgi:ubiquinone/menaquinone biosynthesis C-methylase UbiE
MKIIWENILMSNIKETESKDLELIDLDWLIDHHKSKEQERRQMVDSLDLKSGNIVLDLGCGPGLWTSLMAEKVHPEGKVVGVDFSPDLINFAKERLEKEPFKDIIEFHKSDFYKIPFEDNTFDLVFFGNCFAYVTGHDKIIKEMKRVAKKDGGRVVAKDFDGGLFIVHPIEPQLTLKVMTATAQALKENPPESIFDNFVGRKMHGLFLKAGFKDVSTTSYAIQKYQPLTPEIKRYITGNAEWLAKTGSSYLSGEDLQQWRSHFDPSSDNYILDLEEFYFCMLELMTIGIIMED